MDDYHANPNKHVKGPVNTGGGGEVHGLPLPSNSTLTIPYAPMPRLIYASRDGGALTRFITAMIVTQPHAALCVKSIVLDTVYDSVMTSDLIRAVYNNSSLHLPLDHPRSLQAQAVRGPLPPHPFYSFRSRIMQLTSRDHPQPLFDDPNGFYVRMIALLLSVCVNVEYLYVPNVWFNTFPKDYFKKLVVFQRTEDLDKLIANKSKKPKKNHKEPAPSALEWDLKTECVVVEEW